MRERLRDLLRSDPNPAIENINRFVQDLSIAALAASVYLAGKQIELPETPTTNLARYIAQSGGLFDFTMALSAGAGRVAKEFFLVRILQRPERHSILPPTLQR